MIAFTILGEPASKSNTSQIVTLNRRRKSDGEIVKMPALIKSQKARSYEAAAILQIPQSAKQMLTGAVRLTVKIFYANERSDLDGSVIKDVLQTKYGPVIKGQPRELIRRGVYINDRQVKEEHYFHAIDHANPRAEIRVEAMEPQQTALSMPPVKTAKQAHNEAIDARVPL